MTITETDNSYQLSFGYKPHLIRLIKARFVHRWFDPVNKCWVVSKQHRAELEKFARSFGFVFSGDQKPEVVMNIPGMPELTVDIPLRKDMFPFQKQGVAYALDKKRLIIGDEPGLGKSVQSIATVYHTGAFPCLVICPSSLKINWQREWDMWTGEKAVILSDKVKFTWPRYYEAGLAKVFIVNYESLKKYFVAGIDTPKGAKLQLKYVRFHDSINMFNSVIIDECHRVKSFAAQQTKFTRGICKDKKTILALSGTPVINKPKDLLAQLGIIDRLNDFGGYKKFVERYCGGIKEASNLKELNYKLRTTCFYRRDKADVLKDLPAKMRQVVYCEIDPVHRREYTAAQMDLENYLRQFKGFTQEQIDKSMRGEIMVRITKLKNISARGKLQQVYDFVDDILDSGEKLVLFGHLHEVTGAIKQRYHGCVSITGLDGRDQRQNAVDSFQNNPKVQLAVCSIQAAGVGLTLTSASRVAFVELGWHPAIHDQCEDRCHRIGQQDSVQCTYFLGKDTIDEHIYSIIDEKRSMTNAITGAVDVVETNIVDSIFNLFSQK